MSYLDKTIVELHELLLKKEVTPLSLAKEAIEKAKKDPNNAFETIVEIADNVSDFILQIVPCFILAFSEKHSDELYMSALNSL